MKYRTDIDGLRAIAVLGIIMYHAEIVLFEQFWIEGGYIGVDIFFVISGYLIGRIIIYEIKISNGFSFLNFYERRARRILPALYLVIFTSIPIAYFVLLPTNFSNFINSIFSSIFFLSNIFFYYSGIEYGATDGLLRPFLHTWSLSVEEQFYIILPITCFYFLKKSPKYFLPLLIGLEILSLFLAEWGSLNQPSKTFYYIHTRLWELGTGVLLSYFEILGRGRKLKEIWQKTMPPIGLTTLIISFLYFDEQTRHPSIWTSIPVLGSCLIIWFSNQIDIASKLLSSKIINFVGKISYSLYLWHFPIFAFARIQLGSILNYQKLYLIILTFLCSFISYFFVEKIFRNNQLVKRKVFFQMIFILSVALISIGWNSKHSKNRFQGYVYDNNYLLSLRKSNFDRGWNYFDKFKKPGLIDVLVWGDSHGFDFFQLIHSTKYVKFYNFELCDLRLVFFSNDKNDQEYIDEIEKGGIERTKECIESQEFQKARIVVISDSFNGNELSYIENFIKFLLANEKKVILLSKSEEWPIKPQNNTLLDDIVSNINGDFALFKKDQAEQDLFNKRKKKTSAINKKLKSIASKYGILFLKKIDYQCSVRKSKCSIVTENFEKIYSDHHHYTLEGAKYFGKKVDEMEWFDIPKGLS